MVTPMDDEKIVLAHGSGGSKSAELFRNIFQPRFKNPFLDEVHDGAIIEMNGQKFAYSTDTFVVSPIFFPGGDIGELAVNGTVNDVAMCGAEPLYLSAGFVIEEGFEMKDLDRIVRSMANAAEKAGVMLVTGDTKVVEQGAVDRIYINTSGIGVVHYEKTISPKNAKPGDVIIINGSIGDHGVSVMVEREGFDFTTSIQSDTASLNHIVSDTLKACPDIHVLRDPTRGGLAGTLNEICGMSEVGIELDESVIPIQRQVISIAEILGIDPLYIANEGKMIVIAPEKDAESILNAMRRHDEAKDACVVGKVTENHPGQVVLKTSLGTTRILDMPVGDKLPRIC